MEPHARIIMTVHSEEIAAALGGPQTLGRTVRSLRELRRCVEEGLPVAALDTVASLLTRGPQEATALKHRVVPRSTLRRRTRLSPTESAHTERLARLARLAEHVWEDSELAHEFLTSSQPQLGGACPLDLADTDLGVREVEELLMKIEYALPA